MEQQVVSFSEALDLRVRWARIAVLAPLGKPLDFEDVADLAVVLGLEYPRAPVPTLFEEVPLLASGFIHGQTQAREQFEIDSCPTCHNGTERGCWKHG
jgi:hypothetical protein